MQVFSAQAANIQFQDLKTSPEGFRISRKSPEYVEDIVAIVLATGYSPHAAISWLSKEVLDILNYDEISMRLPIICEQGTVFQPAISNLAFVGFYEGPYWGIMEMHARLIARQWANINSQSPNEVSTWHDLKRH
jgi:hypothetical protein